MKGLERVARWLGLRATSSPFESSPLSHMEQADKLLGRNATPPPRSRPCLSPSRRGLVIAFFFLALSLAVSWIMWCTQIYDESILRLVSIRNDLDMVFDLWRFPPTRPFLNIYIFNYTNVKLSDVRMSPILKPSVTELGPYVFQERTEKINIKFHDNGTVSFQENKTIEFLPHLSSGSLDDSIIVPNIPILTVINMLRSSDYITQMALSRLLFPALDVKPFQKVSVNDFIWGYEDDFYKLTRKAESLLHGKEVPKFGFLAKRRGVHHSVITVNTGYYELDRVAEVERYDGQSQIGKWTEPCDSIHGVEGGLFPGNLIRNRKPMQIYAHEMCRKLPLIYNQTTSSVDGFPVNEYVFPDSIMDYSSSVDANKCYRYNDEYPPKGTFFSGACQKDAPIYATFPHFYNADDKLLETIDGLKPDPAKHRSSFLIHERLGVTLRAQSKFQFNIMFNEAKFVSQYNGMKDGTLLPIAWMHLDSGPLPSSFVNVLYHLTYTATTVGEIIKWIALICLVASIYISYRQVKRNHNIIFRVCSNISLR